MSITYPLTLPSVPSEMTWNQNSINAMTTAIFTGEQYIYNSPGQFWTVQMKFAPQSREGNSQLLGMLMALLGKSGTFYLGAQGLEAVPLGVATGTPLVNGANQDRSQSIITDGWTHSVTGILKAGDFIQIGTWLHRVLQDVNSDSSGNATIPIFPSVRPAVADNTTILTANPVGIFRLAKDISYTQGVGTIYSEINVTAIEVQ